MNPQSFILTILAIISLLSMHANAQNDTDTNITDTTPTPTFMVIPDTTMSFFTSMFSTMETLETTEMVTESTEMDFGTTQFPTDTTTADSMESTEAVFTTMTTTMDTTMDTTTNPTQEPTLEPTIEPTINPITATVADTTTNTEPEEEPIEIEITLTLTLQDNNATEDEIKEIIIDVISDFIDDGFKIVDIIIRYIPISARRRLLAEATQIEYTVILAVKNEETANEIKETVESEEFTSALETELVEAGGGTVSVEATAEIQETEKGNECDDFIWWQPWIWGDCANILLWILLAAVCCVFCIVIICFIRCCYLCCSKTRRRQRGQSNYVVGKAMFGKIESNVESDNAFQADLKNAIEMNKRGGLLKKTGSSLDLDNKAVAAAFDMEFDEITPIKQKDESSDAVVRVQSLEEKEKESTNGKGKDKKEQIKKQETEGLLPETTTPGGPTPGGPDDEENPPPAPAPPTTDPNEFAGTGDYDLL